MWDKIDTIIKSITDIFSPLTKAVEKSVLDKTEKERLLVQVQQAEISLKGIMYQTRMNLAWMKYIAFGSGILIGIMMINNNVIMPYISNAKSMDIPPELWGVFLLSIGGDVLLPFLSKYGSKAAEFKAEESKDAKAEKNK